MTGSRQTSAAKLARWWDMEIEGRERHEAQARGTRHSWGATRAADRITPPRGGTAIHRTDGGFAAGKVRNKVRDNPEWVRDDTQGIVHWWMRQVCEAETYLYAVTGDRAAYSRARDNAANHGHAATVISLHAESCDGSCTAQDSTGGPCDGSYAVVSDDPAMGGRSETARPVGIGQLVDWLFAAKGVHHNAHEGDGTRLRAHVAVSEVDDADVDRAGLEQIVDRGTRFRRDWEPQSWADVVTETAYEQVALGHVRRADPEDKTRRFWSPYRAGLHTPVRVVSELPSSQRLLEASWEMAPSEWIPQTDSALPKVEPADVEQAVAEHNAVVDERSVTPIRPGVTVRRVTVTNDDPDWYEVDCGGHNPAFYARVYAIARRREQSETAWQAAA